MSMKTKDLKKVIAELDLNDYQKIELLLLLNVRDLLFKGSEKELNKAQNGTIEIG